MNARNTDDDVLRLSRVPFRERTRIDNLYDVLIIISAATLCAAIFMADLDVVGQLLFGGVVIWLAMSSVTPEVVLINKKDRTLTRERKFLDRVEVSKQTLSLAEYYGVRVRSADGGSANLQVELVGKYGAVMTLNNFDEIAEAREFRSMVAEFLKFRVVLDPTNPNYT